MTHEEGEFVCAGKPITLDEVEPNPRDIIMCWKCRRKSSEINLDVGMDRCCCPQCEWRSGFAGGLAAGALTAAAIAAVLFLFVR